VAEFLLGSQQSLRSQEFPRFMKPNNVLLCTKQPSTSKFLLPIFSFIQSSNLILSGKGNEASGSDDDEDDDDDDDNDDEDDDNDGELALLIVLRKKATGQNPVRRC
jgi:hypothetical protein